MITLIRSFFLLLGLLFIAQPVLSNAQDVDATEIHGTTVSPTVSPILQKPLAQKQLIQDQLVQDQLVNASGSNIDMARQIELRYMVQQDCGSCHGMTLKGGLGPSLLPERIAALPDQYLFDAIFHGREGAPMPPWASILKTEEIHWIVQQLKMGQLGQTPNKSHADSHVSGKGK